MNTHAHERRGGRGKGEREWEWEWEGRGGEGRGRRSTARQEEAAAVRHDEASSERWEVRIGSEEGTQARAEAGGAEVLQTRTKVQG